MRFPVRRIGGQHFQKKRRPHYEGVSSNTSKISFMKHRLRKKSAVVVVWRNPRRWPRCGSRLRDEPLPVRRVGRGRPHRQLVTRSRGPVHRVGARERSVFNDRNPARSHLGILHSDSAHVSSLRGAVNGSKVVSLLRSLDLPGSFLGLCFPEHLGFRHSWQANGE